MFFYIGCDSGKSLNDKYHTKHKDCSVSLEMYK